MLASRVIPQIKTLHCRRRLNLHTKTITLCNLGLFFKFHNTDFKKSNLILCNAEHVRKFF